MEYRSIVGSLSAVAIASCWVAPAIAVPIPNLTAQGKSGEVIKLEVGTGFGTSLNFVETGEIINRVWLDDPSRINYQGDGNLCQLGQRCQGRSVSQIIHLKQTDPIAFPGIISNFDGSTLLTVITKKQGKTKQYIFELVPIVGKPAAYKYEIEPEDMTPAIPIAPPSKLPPLPPTEIKETNLPRIPDYNVSFPGDPQTMESVTQLQFEIPTDLEKVAAIPLDKISSGGQADSIARTLRVVSLPPVTGQVGDSPGETLRERDRSILQIQQEVKKVFPSLKPRSQLWRKVQNLMLALRQGKSISSAAEKAGIPVLSAEKLISFGEKIDKVRLNSY